MGGVTGARTFLRRFAALGRGPRELKLVYVLKLLESFADFSTSLNLVLYLIEQFGYSDIEAGAMYGAWGVSTSLFGIVFGPAIDRLGVRRSLLVGGALLTAGRAMLAAAPTRAHVLVSLFMLQPLGMALAIPVLSIAIRRTSTNENRSLAFGVFYAVMNIGALLSGLGTDALTTYLRSHVRGGGTSSAMRSLFWIGCATSALYTLLTALAFRELPPVASAATTSAHTKSTSVWRQVKETWADRVFWRLVTFMVVLFGARSIFKHMDVSFPAWMKRTIGADAHYGSVYSINPAIVILTVAPLQAYLADRDPYNIVIVGTAVTSLAPLALAVLPPSYFSAVVFMVVVSAGEVYYSSKTMEFSLMLAPEGQEGVYGTLASVPLFAVRLMSGATGGALLSYFCPAEPPRRCALMWFAIAAVSASTPLVLLLARRCIYTSDVRARIAASTKRASTAAAAASSSVSLTAISLLATEAGDHEHDDFAVSTGP